MYVEGWATGLEELHARITVGTLLERKDGRAGGAARGKCLGTERDGIIRVVHVEDLEYTQGEAGRGSGS